MPAVHIGELVSRLEIVSLIGGLVAKGDRGNRPKVAKTSCAGTTPQARSDPRSDKLKLVYRLLVAAVVPADHHPELTHRTPPISDRAFPA